VRAFLAVPADPGWAAAAAPLASRLRAELPRASWTRADAWHLTLKFLGEVSEEDASRFGDAVASACAAGRAGALPAGGALVLPPRGRPRVLSVGFAPSDAGAALEELARRAEDAGARIGVASEGRPFRPHVTLARIREPWPHGAVDTFRKELDAAGLPAFRCAECVLYSSRLNPAGAVHTPIRTFPLGTPLGAGVEVRA
jgi:RNA 2',3'-cyclic 3'-phosphodiesterase